MIKLPRQIYGWIFLLWPLCFVTLAIGEPSILWIALAVVGSISVVLPAIYCSLPEMKFGDALGYLVSPYCSGCLNITILYIWIFILPFFLYAVGLSIIGLTKGREESRARWHKLLVARLNR